MNYLIYTRVYQVSDAEYLLTMKIYFFMFCVLVAVSIGGIIYERIKQNKK